MVYSLGPRYLSYAVRDGKLVVRTFFKTHTFSLTDAKASITDLDLKKLYQRGRRQRNLMSYMKGTHIYYKDKDRIKIEVYATSEKQGLLIEGQDRIFITPERLYDFVNVLQNNAVKVDLFGGIQSGFDTNK